MIVLADLDPAKGVPDQLYAALCNHSDTDEEVRAARVLRVHRDYLNGGLAQAMSNLHATDRPVALYVEAYYAFNLIAEGELIQKAASAFARIGWPEAGYEILDKEYLLLTYGKGGDEPDAVEAKVLLFAQQNARRFENAVARASAL